MSDQKQTTSPRRHGPGHGPPGMMVEKPKDFKGTIKKLLRYIGSYHVGLVFVLLFAVLGTVFTIVGPKVLSLATTEIFDGMIAKFAGLGGVNFGKIGQILLILLGLYLISAVFSFIQGWLMNGISQRLCFQLRAEISEKIHRMPMKYFESRTVGEVLSRITNDVDALGQNLGQSVTSLITAVTTLLGVLIMMLSISPLMTLISLVILPISGILIGLVVKKSQKYFVAQQVHLGNINGQVEEVYSGQSVVKAFNREAAATKEFDGENQNLFDSAWKSQFLSGLMQPIMMFVGNLGYVAVAITGSVLAIRSVITVGDIQAFIQYVRNFTQPISQVAQISNLLQSMAAAAERVFELLEEEEEPAAPAHPTPISGIEGRVEFSNVHFGYNPDKIIINDFSAKVEPGQMVAIVGPTGAGKTTMVKLLMRFYDVSSGAILVDG
ncbi:MAG: ABC transporter ATP-binding protein, partial [Angelakisella sp.]